MPVGSKEALIGGKVHSLNFYPRYLLISSTVT